MLRRSVSSFLHVSSSRDSPSPSWLVRVWAGVRGGDDSLEVLASCTRYMERIHGWRAEKASEYSRSPLGRTGDHHFGS